MHVTAFKDRIRHYLRRLNPRYRSRRIYASVGDICTKRLLESGIRPSLIIFDGRTKSSQEVKFKIPRGYAEVHVDGLTNRSICALNEILCLKRRVAVKTFSEEDSFAAYAISVAPLGSIVQAGPDMIIIDQENKKAAIRKLNSLSLDYLVLT